MKTAIETQYLAAKDMYAEMGIDTDKALAALKNIPISIHCWQGDDVAGFETKPEGSYDETIKATGNYPGRAASIDQLRNDIEYALSLIPGTHRLNLHASYLDDCGTPVERNEIEVKHFESWAQWGKGKLHGIDFNPTFFGHPKSASGFTLSHPDSSIREFWIEHGKRSREIAAYFGEQFGTPTVNNVWVPDGHKDIPIDRTGPRARLIESLDAVFEKEFSPELMLDAVESKLFGLGAESYTPGSHEFYMGYALSRGKMLCLDSGHYHPTEMISEKISSILLFSERLLLHVSRPVRWDSDHIVLFGDELVEIAHELVRSGKLPNIHIGLDFFDASINRIAAWAIGARNMQKALLFGLLEPTASLIEAENNFDFTKRMAVQEELKGMPWAAVWNYFCLINDAPVGLDWYEKVKAYEKDVLSKR
jgi:L-rhamnose isomerase